MKKSVLTTVSILFSLLILFFLFKPISHPYIEPLQDGYYYNLLGRKVGKEKPKLPGIYSLVEGKKAKKVIIPPEANP